MVVHLVFIILAFIASVFFGLLPLLTHFFFVWLLCLVFYYSVYCLICNWFSIKVNLRRVFLKLCGNLTFNPLYSLLFQVLIIYMGSIILCTPAFAMDAPDSNLDPASLSVPVDDAGPSGTVPLSPRISAYGGIFSDDFGLLGELDLPADMQLGTTRSSQLFFDDPDFDWATLQKSDLASLQGTDFPPLEGLTGLPSLPNLGSIELPGINPQGLFHNQVTVQSNIDTMFAAAWEPAHAGPLEGPGVDIASNTVLEPADAAPLQGPSVNVPSSVDLAGASTSTDSGARSPILNFKSTYRGNLDLNLDALDKYRHQLDDMSLIVRDFYNSLKYLSTCMQNRGTAAISLTYTKPGAVSFEGLTAHHASTKIAFNKAYWDTIKHYQLFRAQLASMSSSTRVFVPALSRVLNTSENGVNFGTDTSAAKGSKRSKGE